MTARSVLFVYNARSGRGSAARAMPHIARAMHARGIELIERPLHHGVPSVDELRACHGVIAAGGDGTVNALSANAAASGAALYHFPAGTENLFARELSMSADPGDVAAWIDAGAVRTVDLAACGTHDTSDRSMVLMFSAGPDAGVIRRLSSVRRGAITHASYAPHVVRELLSPSLPVVSVETDGAALIEGKRGMLVVANFRSYGGGFNPAARAINDDGLLDVVFLPAGSGPAWLWSMLMCKGGHGEEIPGYAGVRARNVRVVLEHGGSVQTDGEHLWSGRTRREFAISIRPGALRVFSPPNAI